MRAAPKSKFLAGVLDPEDSHWPVDFFWTDFSKHAVKHRQKVDWRFKWIFEVKNTYIAEHDQESNPFVAAEKNFLEELQVAACQSIDEASQWACLQ